MPTPAKKPRPTPRSRAQRVIEWIESHCHIPEGKFVGRKFKLREFQKNDIRKIYDNPAKGGTRRAIVSYGRKNAKTTLAAALSLCHLCGPEYVPNGQLFSAAQSRDQAAILFALAAKIVRASPKLVGFVRIKESTKQLFCDELGKSYRALSADAATSLGLSPVFVVHDELGQSRRPIRRIMLQNNGFSRFNLPSRQPAHSRTKTQKPA